MKAEQAEMPLDDGARLRRLMTAWRNYAMDIENNPCTKAKRLGSDEPFVIPAKRFECANSTDVPQEYRDRVPLEDRRGSCGDGQERICHLGDIVNFNALLAYAGESIGHEVVQASQGSDGRWWRSPLQELHRSDVASFSEDMAIGVLLHLVTHPDRRAARGQAKAWLDYMRSLGNASDWAFEVGKDIGEEVVRQLIRSLVLLDCDGNRGIPCVVTETVEQVVTDWKRIRETAECVAGGFPGIAECWEEVQKSIRVEVPKVLRFATNSLCRDGNLGSCQARPEFWQLMFDVWNFLGLNPSGSMKFCNQLFEFAGGDMDEHLRLQQEGYDMGILGPRVRTSDPQNDYVLHKTATHLLIRALIGQNVSKAMSNLVQRNPGHLFFQFLNHRYVNRNSFSIDAIRTSFLRMAPETLYSRDQGQRFLGKGHQWVWERDQPHEIASDSMGWDLIFMGRLIVQEYSGQLDFYKEEILPGLIRKAAEELRAVARELRAAYEKSANLLAEYEEFIAKAASVIEDEEAEGDELDELATVLRTLFESLDSTVLQRLRKAYFEANRAYETFDVVVSESRRRFSDADRLDEHIEVWSEVLQEFETLPGMLTQVRQQLASGGLREQLRGLCASLSLRMERELLRDISNELREQLQATIETLGQLVHDSQLAAAKEEITEHAYILSRSLYGQLLRRRYVRAESEADSMEERLNEGIAPVLARSSHLDDEEKGRLRDDARAVVQPQLTAWERLRREQTVGAVVSDRLDRVINPEASRVFERVQQLSDLKQRAAYYLWAVRASEAGYPPAEGCGGDGSYARGECWLFDGPQDGTPEDWIAFDIVLNDIERMIAEFEPPLAKIAFRETGEQERNPAALLELPATGVVFDAKASCEASEQDFGTYYDLCQVPTRSEFRAAPVSSTEGNSDLENLPYLNRLVIHTEGKALDGSYFSWSLNSDTSSIVIADRPADQRRVPVPFAGATLVIVAHNFNPLSRFLNGGKVEVLANYVFPHPQTLSLYSSHINSMARLVSQLIVQIAPDSREAAVVGAITQAIDTLNDALRNEELTPITELLFEETRDYLVDAKSEVDHECDRGAALCSEKIAEVGRQLRSRRDELAEKLEALRRFLNGEIARLTGLAEQYDADMLERLRTIRSASHPAPLAVTSNDVVITTEQRFWRGEVVSLTFPNDDAQFRGGQSSYSGVIRSGNADVGHLWVWVTHRLCGRARYRGTEAPLSSAASGLPRAPHFGIDGCGETRLNMVRVSGNREMVNRTRMDAVRQINRYLRLDMTLYLCLKPQLLSGVYKASASISMTWGSSLIRGDTFNFQRPNDTWFYETVTFRVKPQFYARDIPGGGGPLKLSFGALGFGVQVLQIDYQLLNPDT